MSDCQTHKRLWLRPATGKFELQIFHMYCFYLSCWALRLNKSSWFGVLKFATLDRSSWSKLRYFNFKLSLKLRLCHAWDSNSRGVCVLGFTHLLLLRNCEYNTTQVSNLARSWSCLTFWPTYWNSRQYKIMLWNCLIMGKGESQIFYCIQSCPTTTQKSSWR